MLVGEKAVQWTPPPPKKKKKKKGGGPGKITIFLNFNNFKPHCCFFF